MSFSATFQINLWHLDNENKKWGETFFEEVFLLSCSSFSYETLNIIIEEKLQQTCRVLYSRNGPAYLLLANKHDNVCRKRAFSTCSQLV